MASSTPLKDLAENFFQCSVCLDTFQEPKQLPCLHRYCSNCLRTVIEASDDGAIRCPLCNQECVIPQNGVDGIKTDFHMKSVLEFIELQKSFESNDLKKCVSCLQQKQISTYCFKCRDFLCEQCYKVHVSSKMFTDHQPHLLKLDNMEVKDLTLEKLSALTGSPRCPSHVQERAQLCCSSCQNVPVCLACTYGGHKGHDLHDVTEVAKRERKLLESKHDELNVNRNKLFGLPNKIRSATRQLEENVARKTEKLMTQHKRQTVKINNKLAERKCVREKGLTDIETRRKEEIIQNDLKFDEELLQLREKYDKIRKTTKRKYDHASETFVKECYEIEGELSKQLQSLDNNLKSLTSMKERLTEQNKKELKRISDHCEQIIRRYKNFTATASSILASKDDWTDIQCIPDVRAACEPLIEEMEKEFPEVESLSEIFMSDMEKVCLDNVTLSEQKKTFLAINKVQIKNWRVTGITCIGDGNIVITGPASRGYSHITVLNEKGDIQRKRTVKGINTTQYRACCYLSDFKVATVCDPDEIGIYDARDGSYKKRHISKTVNDWPEDGEAVSIAADLVNNRLIVGSSKKNMFVFDFTLNYLHKIALPSASNCSFDIKVFHDILLICDLEIREAYALSMEGSRSKLMYKFPKPDYGVDNIVPINLCIDRNKFIYILWAAQTSEQIKCIIAQYNRDGSEMLTTIMVDDDRDHDADEEDDGINVDAAVVDDADNDDRDDGDGEDNAFDDVSCNDAVCSIFCCMATMESGETDDLLISLFKSQKLCKYHLIVK